MGLLFVFAVLSAHGQDTSPWKGEPTRLDVLVGDTEKYIAKMREDYRVSEEFSRAVEAAIGKHAEDTCIGDYEGFITALAALADEAQSQQGVEPTALEGFRNIFKTDLLMNCPQDMVLVEGSYCIDKHEYPGKEGESPQGGVLWAEAKETCEKAGKHLCTEKEWFRACKGPACIENSFPETFDFKACGVTNIFAPPDAEWKIKDREQCMSVYGVDDLAGGMWEWIEDEFHGGFHVLRNGASPGETRPACDKSIWLSPEEREAYAGFRCCAQPVITKPQ